VKTHQIRRYLEAEIPRSDQAAERALLAVLDVPVTTRASGINAETDHTRAATLKEIRKVIEEAWNAG
jgi:hypothetical protein